MLFEESEQLLDLAHSQYESRVKRAIERLIDARKNDASIDELNKIRLEIRTLFVQQREFVETVLIMRA